VYNKPDRHVKIESFYSKAISFKLLLSESTELLHILFCHRSESISSLSINDVDNNFLFADIRNMPYFRNLTALKYENIISNIQFLKLADYLGPTLQLLSLSAAALTEDSVIKLISSCPNIIDLKLENCNRKLINTLIKYLNSLI